MLRDRAPLYVALSDGGVRNAYTLKVSSKRRDGAAALALVLDGPRGLVVAAPDSEADAQGRPLPATRPDGVAEHRVFVVAPPSLHLPASVPVTFRLLDAQGHEQARHQSVFLGPRP